ncbi:MAG: hypothetical protein GTO42_02520 [Candidatus Latescibacteria bacterium]|nr:hypothetical protein [Candidatus Latescibacterota bacterium]NIO01011.1 hypothetical protein [Candidatus Latescibacterota bacterium]NIO27410.1 hypothetical protein [Candidatus Latescibacterota bacterium]NIO54932.1 hypothetical protein [Candidatus Latescibacterota bacterium]NIT01021.1 hypothetical protein [Candidatus Latescibacterota bacterium]
MFARALSRSALVVFLSVVVWLFLVPTPGLAKDDVHFVYNFKPGSSQKFEIDFGQETSFSGRNYVFLSEMELTETCIEIEESGLFKMEVTFIEVSSSMRMNDKLIDNKMDEVLVGQTLGYRVNKIGEVSDIRPKSYIEGWRQFSQVLDALINGWYPELPDSTIGVGGNWVCLDTTETMREDQRVTMITRVVCQFEEMTKEKGRQCAKIKGEGASHIDGEKENKFEFEYCFDPKEVGIVKFKAKIEGESQTIELKKELK